MTRCAAAWPPWKDPATEWVRSASTTPSTISVACAFSMSVSETECTFFAAHRGAADAAGTDWKSAVYQKIEEAMKANRGLAVTRMVELGGVSRASFYRFDEEGAASVDATWTCAMRFSGSLWSGPVMADRVLRPS